MPTTLIIVLAASFLFGGMVLILALGYKDAEQNRTMQADASQSEAVQQAAAAVALPGFFAPLKAVQPLTMSAFDDAQVSRLENHIRLEQALAAQFVHHPSLDNLYRHPTPPVHMH